MFDLIEEAKRNKHEVIFENYQTPTITWEQIVNYLYKESKIYNPDLKKRVERIKNYSAFNFIGNIQIQEQFWLAPQTHNLFNEFDGISELLKKINNGVDTKDCIYYGEVASVHNCKSDWHAQGIRISLSDRLVSDHHDPHDIFYWQILGTSFWKIDNSRTYTLKPGDMLYLPLENSHEVWCDGPRAGLLIDNLN